MWDLTNSGWRACVFRGGESLGDEFNSLAAAVVCSDFSKLTGIQGSFHAHLCIRSRGRTKEGVGTKEKDFVFRRVITVRIADVWLAGVYFGRYHYYSVLYVDFGHDFTKACADSIRDNGFML